MKIFQGLYDFFKKLSFPSWMKPYIQELNDVMVGVFKKAGESYLSYARQLIVDAAKNPSLSAKEKFSFVFKNLKSSGITAVIALKDNEINTLINYLVTKLKKECAI